MSDSVRPHRRQPTRLPSPWDSPGKNTGVGCHFLLQCMKVKSESEVAQSCPTPSDPMDCSLPGSFIHGIFQARVLEWGADVFSDILGNLGQEHKSGIRINICKEIHWKSKIDILGIFWNFYNIVTEIACYHQGSHFILFSKIQSVQSLSRVQLFATPWTAALQAPLSIISSWSLLRLMSIKSVMPSNHLILCRPLLLPPSIFPSIRVFSNESALRIRWPKYQSSASTSVLLVNIKDWSP